MIHTPIRSTTILEVRLGRKVALAGDGQVTLGEMQLKSRAVKVARGKRQRVAHPIAAYRG